LNFSDYAFMIFNLDDALVIVWTDKQRTSLPGNAST
jgi:hypothetical protein